jgi:hypothetical protein
MHKAKKAVAVQDAPTLDAVTEVKAAVNNIDNNK